MTLDIPITLFNVLYETYNKQYAELYEVTDNFNYELEVDVQNILGLLKSDSNDLTYLRYLWMGLIMGFAVKPTVTSYSPSDVRPSLILKSIKALFFREQSKQLYYKLDLVPDEVDYSFQVSNLCEHLFPYKSEGSQALDEALNVFWNLLRMSDTQLAEEALIEILDDCFEGYAIFPGSQHKRELFNWWLTDVVLATWNLRFPTQIFTIKGLVKFTSEHFLEL